MPAKTPACFMILSLVAVWAALTAAAAAVEAKASFEWKFNCSEICCLFIFSPSFYDRGLL